MVTKLMEWTRPFFLLITSLFFLPSFLLSFFLSSFIFFSFFQINRKTGQIIDDELYAKMIKRIADGESSFFLSPLFLSHLLFLF